MSPIKSPYVQLKELQDLPQQQSLLALQLLQSEDDKQLLTAALKVLTTRPHADGRSPLIAFYNDLSTNGELSDPGGEQRALTMDALRQIADSADTPVFEQAAMTYEFLPPLFREEAGPLRAAAIVGLNDINESMARFHASRILVESYSDPMSGEPGATAARVLASQDQLHCLYQYVYQDLRCILPEVASECLRLLTPMPLSLIPGLIERLSNSDNDLILAGLFELLINHEDGPVGQEFIMAFLRDSKRYDLYRYLVALLVAESRNFLLPSALQIFKFEKDGQKAAILAELLSPLDYDLEISSVLDHLQGLVES